MRGILKIIITISCVFILVFASGIFYLSRGLSEGMNIGINGINISDLNDGIYSGKYNAGRWSNQLNVTVRDHKIIKINIEDDVTFAKSSVSDELFNKVIEAQNTKTDVISQATVTSKAYLKSIEDALNN
ncbi:FMN-binding protein [Tissierella creatinophila]|uniref:FMN-binding domain protein n=1 Tax=Tissierella creatinophila DSM 6911 TaxID=1123403 RepID=A0A1U7M318_TISCR|nr:FMN-binding protein [Tissierella creatinophila]OLS01609.1 FMN-binding domain protein [Tissierella creatinophila DSM 6911]